MGIFATLTTSALTFQPQAETNIIPHHRQRSSTIIVNAARYGPPPSSDMPPPLPNDPSRQVFSSSALQIQEFRQLLEKVMSVKDPQHIPSLLTKHMDLILAVNGEQGVAVVQSILDQARQETNNDPAILTQFEQAIDMTLQFAEDFVNAAQSLDEQNKQLVGKILRCMSNKDLAPRAREEALDELFTTERSNFSAGFLRHLQGECDRVAQSTATEAPRTLQMLRVIQARVLEEVGQGLGQAAVVLGQLIAYEDAAERKAILQAGLMVRGVDFATELQALTTEALDGLGRAPGGADPELIRIVQSIDEAIHQFLEKEQSFQ